MTHGSLRLNTTGTEQRSDETSPPPSTTGAMGRRNSVLLNPRSSFSIMTPRGGGGRLGSFIRTSYLEEKKIRGGFWWRLAFEDPEIEQLYMEESWKKTKRGYIIFLSLLMVNAAWDWFMLYRSISRSQWVLSLIALIVAALTPNARQLCKLHGMYGSFGATMVLFIEAFINCDSGVSLTSPYQCERLEQYGEIPPMWLMTPVLHQMVVYLAPLSFYEGLPGRVLLILVSGTGILYNSKNTTEGFGLFLSFVAANAVLLKELHKLEKSDREYFLEAHMALKSLTSMPQKEESLAAQEEETTLVRNAMHLAFPNNPFHDKAAEARIEKCRQELATINQDNQFSEGLVPIANAPVPRHVLYIAGKLRGIRVARYKHHGDPVVVQSIPNLEVLESDKDLLEFIKVVDDASNLAEIPGLTKTWGYCLSPCTFVVEDVVADPVVTLKDLTLELGAKELRLDWYFLKPLIASLSGALAMLHENGILHRFVSSATIILTSKDSCVLPPIAFHHTLPEARKKLWGNPSIWRVAPEAKENYENYTAASEVWALCVVAWEMLVGPFTFQVTPFAFPPTVPKGIVNLIIEGLSDDPDGRPTMKELFNAFNQTDPSRDSTVASAEVFERVLSKIEANGEGSSNSMDSSKSPYPTDETKASSQTITGDTAQTVLGNNAEAETDHITIKPVLHVHHNQQPALSPSRATHRVKFASFDDSELS